MPEFLAFFRVSNFVISGHDPSSAMILLRAHAVDTRLEAFADTLESLSGLRVVYLLDERSGAIDSRGREKVSLTESRCEALGLYCPRDFAWRCGDYGFYLARAQFPDIRNIWMIENDVRIAGRDPAAFFRKFEGLDADLLCGHLEEPEDGWIWLNNARSSDASPLMCFFPVVRLSAYAVDILLEKRRAHSRLWARRQLWPNDEVFVGTTLRAAGTTMADLNAGEPAVYRHDEFAFSPARDGDAMMLSNREVALFHPVLFGAALEHKRRKLAERERTKTATERLRRRLRWIATPKALARAMNQRSEW